MSWAEVKCIRNEVRSLNATSGSGLQLCPIRPLHWSNGLINIHFVMNIHLGSGRASVEVMRKHVCVVNNATSKFLFTNTLMPTF